MSILAWASTELIDVPLWQEVDEVVEKSTQKAKNSRWQIALELRTTKHLIGNSTCGGLRENVRPHPCSGHWSPVRGQFRRCGLSGTAMDNTVFKI